MHTDIIVFLVCKRLFFFGYESVSDIKLRTLKIRKLGIRLDKIFIVVL